MHFIIANIMGSDNLQAFIERSAELHKAVDTILTHDDPDYVREQADIRSDFKLDLNKLKDEIQSNIWEMEKIKREVAREAACQTLDVKKLDSRKMGLYSDRKRANV